jgi:hypothetical protein
VWFLEKNKILTEYQSGFRKSRSTTDQLVRLESYIREAFVRCEHVVSVFFDVEKAFVIYMKPDCEAHYQILLVSF